MAHLQAQFIMRRLGLSQKAAKDLNTKYYREHGLTIIGLQKFHGIDPLEFNKEVDERLPMNTVLSRSKQLIDFFESFDRTKVKLWLFTNAFVSHGLRVTELLGIAHFFEGITYCDYAGDVAVCKPSMQMLLKAEKESGATRRTKCYYVDDNVKNCAAAATRGWQVLWIKNDPTASMVQTIESVSKIAALPEIHLLFPQFVRST